MISQDMTLCLNESYIQWLGVYHGGDLMIVGFTTAYAISA
jgi:hypothetical protein